MTAESKPSKEDVKLNIFQKIQKARVMLQKKSIKKSGVNKFSNYKYFEMSDFLPPINEICDSVGLYTEFLYLGKCATLTIYDADNSAINRQWSMPIEVASLKGCSNIQNIGGTQSYARRYLYMMAFEIAENDVLDSGDTVDTDKELGKQKINKNSVLTIRKLLTETGTDEQKLLTWLKVKAIEDITNDSLNSVLQELNTRKELLKKKQQQEKKVQEQFENNNGDFDF